MHHKCFGTPIVPTIVHLIVLILNLDPLKKYANFLVPHRTRVSVTEYVLYFRCHRIYYNGSVTHYTNLFIFCDTCLQWDFHYNIFKDTCFRVYILQHLVLKYIL